MQKNQKKFLVSPWKLGVEHIATHRVSPGHRFGEIQEQASWEDANGVISTAMHGLNDRAPRGLEILMFQLFRISTATDDGRGLPCLKCWTCEE